MPRKSIYFPDGLWERVSDAAGLDGRSVSGWVAQRLEAALSEARGGLEASRSTGPPVPSSEGVRSTVSPRASVPLPSTSLGVDRAEAFRRAGRKS